MKFFQATHDYPHSWDKVTSAVWKKYPNEKAAHVVAVDVLNQWVDPETGMLTVERLITCKQSVPALIKRIFNTDDVTHAREVVTVNPKTHEFEAKTVNLSFANLMAIEETCKYVPKPQSHATSFEQYAQISVVGKLWRLTDYVEDFSLNRFKENAVVGREAMHLVLERLFGATAAPASL